MSHFGASNRLWSQFATLENSNYGRNLRPLKIEIFLFFHGQLENKSFRETVNISFDLLIQTLGFHSIIVALNSCLSSLVGCG